MAACLSTGGRASHRSAAWLHGLLDVPPPAPVVTAGPAAGNLRYGVRVHRSRVAPAAASVREVPCTDAARTVVDLAAELAPAGVDDIVDRALARRLASVDLLLAEARRCRRRRGAGVLRWSLERRGYAGAPQPSVLESRMLRLLARHGIVALSCELVVDRYRLDVVLAPRLAVEVDGFAYHSDPDALRYDHRRRQELRRQGWEILVYPWVDLRDEPDRVATEIRTAVAAAA